MHATTPDALTIYPTHTCFDDALDYLVLLHDAGEPFAHLIIVHALCLVGNELAAHAWLEDLADDTCIFAGTLRGKTGYCMVDRAVYRTGLRIQDETRYSVAEALDANARTE